MDVYTSTSRLFAEKAKKHRSVLVYFSGGKDSVVLADMCSRVFDRMVLVHFEFVPGVPLVESILAQAQQRWGAEDVIRLPAKLGASHRENGSYGWKHHTADTLKCPGHEEFAPYLRRETGIDLVAAGGKKNDSLGNRIGVKEPHKHVWRPLWQWLNADILAYLAMHKIPRPPTPGGKSVSLVDLTTNGICWLYDNYRDSYDHLRFYFPFIPAVIARRAMYGIPAERIDTYGRIVGTGGSQPL